MVNNGFECCSRLDHDFNNMSKSRSLWLWIIFKRF